MKQCSILIPSRNGKEALELTIESIFARTDYPNYKIVVYDSTGLNTQDREYLMKQRDAGNLELIELNVATKDESLPITELLKYCTTEHACILHSDVEILDRQWLNILANSVKSANDLGATSLKPEGVRPNISRFIAPVFQTFCIFLNMPLYHKINGDIKWTINPGISLESYKGKEIFKKFPYDFDRIYGDPGWGLAEKVLFEYKSSINMHYIPHGYNGSKICHWGGISILYKSPDHPRVKNKWKLIREHLKILRETGI